MEDRGASVNLITNKTTCENCSASFLTNDYDR